MNVVIDYRASTKTVDTLKKMGYNVIFTPHLSILYNTICGHSDIMLHKINKNTVVVEPTVYNYFLEKMKNITVLKGITMLKSEYPFDIAYNCARVGNNIFCNEKFTDKRILNHYRENGYKIINSKQGYAKCSICIVSDNAIITSDKNISIQAEKNRIDVLRVDDSKIKLIGFEHGFIGGATGLITKDILAVNGDIQFHSDCNKILDFCYGYNIKVLSLNNEEITDIGSIISV